MPINFSIDGRNASELTDAELEQINQRLGARVEAIQTNRALINRYLASRRARAHADEAQRVAERAAVAAAELAAAAVATQDAAAPGAVIELDLDRPLT